MPMLRRKPFTPNPLPADLEHDGEYFVCQATGEVFKDYEAFFERVIMCNSLVWTCSVTGRPGLTYPEAIACEKKALAIIDRFPEHLRGPVLHLATLTHRTRINDLNEDVYVYIRDVYFKNEIIEAIHEDEWWEGKVVQSFLIADEEQEEEKEECGADEPDWDHIRYNVRLWDDETSEYIEGEDGLVVVDTSCIRREKNGLHSISQDKCKMFLKYHCEQVEGIWRVKTEYLEKHRISGGSFSDYICLEEPKFTHSKAPVKKQSRGRSKSSRRTDEDLELIREAKLRAREAKEAKVKEAKNKVKKEAKEKMTPEEKAAQRLAVKERQRVEREKQREEAATKQAEERLRLRELREQERLKAREEKRMLADRLREWNKPRDDLLCDDLVQFPSSLTVPSVLAPYFGDIVMVVEFLHIFGEQLDVESSFPDGVTLDLVEKAIFESDINGPLSDLLCFFLSSIFNCLEEEEEEEGLESAEGQQGKAEPIDETGELGELTYKELICSATSSSQISQLNHGTSLRGFQLDPLTVSEVLRLHFLASGAKSSSASIKFRYQSRGGYTSLDDAGIELKKDHPHILSALAIGNVFDLNVRDKLTILSTLMNQLLSYASLRDVIEESMDQYKSLSYELKQIQWAEQRREREEAQLKHKKRLEQKLQVQQLILAAGENPVEKMETDQKPDVKPEVKPEPSASSEANNVSAQNEEAAREARKIAKRILNDTAKLDPNRIPQDTGRSRRKNAPADDFNWREYDMTEWNNLEERYLGEEDLETLNSRRKEIETRQKQDYIDREAEMYDTVNDLASRVGTHSLGQDRWGRTYWSFNCIPNLYVERIDKEIITQPTDLNGSLHSEKENVPSKQNNISSAPGAVNPLSATNGEVKSAPPNSTLESDPSHSEAAAWVYYDNSDSVDQLVSSVLNNRGLRESALKQKIITRRRKIQQLSELHPEFLLDEHSIHEASKPVAATNQNIKSRSRIAKGLIQNTSAQESLELNLREMLLDLEERVFVGALGKLKITNRANWREALESGSYSPQDKELSILTVQDIDPSDGDSLVVRDLLRALLQIQRAVESKYLCKPLGFAEVDKKKAGPKKARKEEAESEEKSSTEEETTTVKTVDRWTESLLNATSLSQIFLHMCTLESSIIWSKSALNARCRLCRRKGDGEKMLLCDMCDRGHHMYCLKPPVKDVPRGDWFCPECRPKQTRSRRASRRKSFYEEEEQEEEESGEEAGEEEETDDSVYDEDTAGSSEEEPKHPKIKLLKATGSRGSGRSSPASSASGRDTKLRRSRTSTPEVDSSRYRRSAAPSPEVVPSKKSKKLSEGSNKRKSKGSRPSSPDVGGRNSLGSARSNLSEEVAQLAQCEEIVREMMEMEDCWPFLAPVSKREVPDYYMIIKHPMDCQTILSQSKMVKYTNVKEMLGDVRQMFKNCSIYNKEKSDIYKMGERMGKFFEKQVRALRLEVNSSKRARRT